MLRGSTKAMDLWNKPMGLDFTEDEIEFLMGFLGQKGYRVKYGFYNKISAKGKYLTVLYDSMPNMNRRTGVENNWEFISERAITDAELREYIIFYYRASFKRFLVFYYADIDAVIATDIKLGAITPKDFVKSAERRYRVNSIF